MGSYQYIPVHSLVGAAGVLCKLISVVIGVWFIYNNPTMACSYWQQRCVRNEQGSCELKNLTSEVQLTIDVGIVKGLSSRCKAARGHVTLYTAKCTKILKIVTFCPVLLYLVYSGRGFALSRLYRRYCRIHALSPPYGGSISP